MPVTAVNSAILVVAAILYGYDSIAFANERSARYGRHAGVTGEVNHQWSKGYAFEQDSLGNWPHGGADLATARCCGR